MSIRTDVHCPCWTAGNFLPPPLTGLIPFRGTPPQLPTALPGDCHPTEPFSLALGSGCPVYPSCSSAWIHLCLYPEHKLILSLLMAEWC